MQSSNKEKIQEKQMSDVDFLVDGPANQMNSEACTPTRKGRSEKYLFSSGKRGLAVLPTTLRAVLADGPANQDEFVQALNRPICTQ